MRRRGLLIAFSGIDGSGKTTQVKLLESRLKQNGVRTLKVWSRWRPLLSLPLLQVLRRTSQVRVHRADFLTIVEFQNPKNEGMASLWCFATQLENFLKTSLKIVFPLMLGRTVICDRYTLDLLVDGISDLHDPTTRMRFGFKLLKLLPRPDGAFLIDIDAETAFGRKPDLPSVAHNVERIRVYLELCKKVEENYRVSLPEGEMYPNHDAVTSRCETSQNRLEDDHYKSFWKESVRRSEPGPFDQSFLGRLHSSCGNQRTRLLAGLQVAGSSWNNCSSDLHSLRYEGRIGAPG